MDRLGGVLVAPWPGPHELGQALDLADGFDPSVVSVVVDAFHVWWDPELHAGIRRAGLARLLAFHVCDWLVRDNLGVDLLPGAFAYDGSIPPPADEAATILWLDAFTANIDRTPHNPNLVRWHGQTWCIDHGAALYFHYSWPSKGSHPERFAAQRFDLGSHIMAGVIDLSPAAETTGKLTRTPGLAVLTAGPGVTNGVSAVAQACFSGSPLVVLGGRAATYSWGRGALQELDHPSLLGPVTKRAATIGYVDKIADEVDDAFRLAAAPHRGPVLLDVPMDELYGDAEGRPVTAGETLPSPPDAGDVDAIAQRLTPMVDAPDG